MQSTKPFLKEQFRKMSALRMAPSDDVAIKAIIEQWERILDHVGEQRFARGVSKCIEKLSFFPTTVEFEDSIPSADSDRVTCPKCCKSEGFEYVDVTSPGGAVSRGVRRCKHNAA